MSSPLRLGIVGAGAVTQVAHLPVLTKMKGIEVAALATFLARAGDLGRARTLLAHWPGRTDHWLIMAALLAVGDTAVALDRLERTAPVPYLWSALRRPEFDALHGNLRFQRLLAARRPEEAVGS